MFGDNDPRARGQVDSISLLGNTAGATSAGTGPLILAGGNNITLSASTAIQGGMSVTISAPNQTVESQTVGISNLGNTSGTSGVASGGQVRLILAGGNNVTLSQSVNGASATITISGANIPAQTVESQTVGISNLGNTSGTSGVASGGQVQLVLAGGNNITLSQSLNGASATITISAPNLGAGGAFSAGVSTGGNTAGSTGITGTQYIFVGTGPISLSQSTGANGGTLSINAPATSSLSAGNNITLTPSGSTISVIGASVLSVGMSNIGNTSGTTGLFSNQVVLVGGNNITLSQSTGAGGATITISSPAIFTKSRFNPYMEAVAVAGQLGQGSLHLHPIPDPDNFQFDRLILDVLVSLATSTTGSATFSFWAGLYTRNASTLSLLASASSSQGLTINGTQNSTILTGGKLFTMGWTTTITQADLWFGLVSRSTTGGAAAITISNYQVSDVNSNFSGILGVASNATNQDVLGLGFYSASTSAMPGSIGFSQIQGTNSNALRPPLYKFLSVTV
jgi:hypothetical protein